MMIYRKSEPCLYMSCSYGNVQAPRRADDFGKAVPDSHDTLSTHSFSTGVIVIHYRSGGRSVDQSYFNNVSLIDSVSFQISCRFPDLINPAKNGM